MINDKELNIEHGASWNTYSLIIQILYLPFGLFSGFLTILYIVVLFFSIIGIPCAIILAKSLSTIINPVGKVCVPKGVAEEIDRRKSKDELDAALNSGTVEIDATKKNELLPSETIALNNNSVSRVSWVRLIKTVIVLALLAVGYLLYIFF